ncbi:MAG: single-stranded DNA-binding protein [Treponema sp.]|nr:single-stranded DNA-binding protein [Treponema sp.]
MNQLNSLILEGNITREPEYRETPHGCKVCSIPLAVNRYYKNSDGQGIEEVSYFDIEVFGKMAEYCQTRTDKGRGMRVVGRLKQNRWKTTEGKNASRITIIAEHIEFKPRLDKKTENKDELNDIAAATTAAAAEYEMNTEKQETEEALF